MYGQSGEDKREKEKSRCGMRHVNYFPGKKRKKFDICDKIANQYRCNCASPNSKQYFRVLIIIILTYSMLRDPISFATV